VTRLETERYSHVSRRDNVECRAVTRQKFGKMLN
jgi:hypothetical protein